MPFESGHGAKVLIVADDANGERPLQTFLSSMGCSCTVATARELATAEAARRTFDAVLLDLRYSARPAERLTSFVEGMPLSLKERTLLISSDRPDAQTMNLADRYSLPRLTENRLIFGCGITSKNYWPSRESSTRPRRVSGLLGSYLTASGGRRRRERAGRPVPLASSPTSMMT